MGVAHYGINTLNLRKTEKHIHEAQIRTTELCVLQSAAPAPHHRPLLRCLYPRVSGSLCTGGEHEHCPS